MGCDIHGTIEKRVGNRWVMVTRMENCLARDRNYKRFSALADVRSYDELKHPKPKGLPMDVSESTKLYVDEWSDDGHSHSYLSMNEILKIMLETENTPTEYMQKYPISAFFDIEHYESEDLRVVFWFDN